MMGGLPSTQHTYQFKSLLHPARDIATTISFADPAGHKLPTRLRGWNLVAEDGWQNPITIHLKKLLGMILHTYYLMITDNRLDVSNDLGDRVILPYDLFLSQVERLSLAPEDKWIVICSLTEEKLKRGQGNPVLMANVPGPGDLLHFLTTLRLGKWPVLKETIWTRFFEAYSSTIDPDENIINDSPFLMGGSGSGLATAWRMGWRRDNRYATAWFEVSQLLHEIRSFFLQNTDP